MWHRLAVRSSHDGHSPGNLGLSPPRTVEELIAALEKGTVVKKPLSRSKKTETGQLALKLDTGELVWQRAVVSNAAGNGKFVCDGCINFWEIREVRIGGHSKEFERAEKQVSVAAQNQRCFLVLYGGDFRLKTWSIITFSDAECSSWVRCLLHVVKETREMSSPRLEERWLRSEFQSMAAREGREPAVTMKDLKSWLPRVNAKMSVGRLTDAFQQVDLERRYELNFGGFSLFYQNLVFDSQIFNCHLCRYMSDPLGMTSLEFQAFLAEAQQDPALDYETMSLLMNSYSRNSDVHPSQPKFSPHEFLDYLYSMANDLWDPQYSGIHQDMSQPLNHYWIASSHNTYLTGDQFSSVSSCEAYVRTLRTGCRCIELDCWDGPDGYPLIYHGHTLTTKIRFLDVIRVIKEHAFVASEYPVILSLEDHCSLPQQRRMAQGFLEVFGNMLLTSPVDKNETALPSPTKLKGKIILKHKKLPESSGSGLDRKKSSGSTTSLESSFVADGGDPVCASWVHNGILYLESPDQHWRPHVFVLTSRKLSFTGETNLETDVDDDGTASSELDSNGASGREEELHYAETWFHGHLKPGRAKAEELLKKCSHLGDGTFLVRESETFVGDYTLSFWKQGKANHVRIKSIHDPFSGRSRTRFYIIETMPFDSLYSLITHYRSHPLRSRQFHIDLNTPVPQPSLHLGQPWFRGVMGRSDAEELLSRVPFDCAFLVRSSEKKETGQAFSISFRSGGKIKHCRVQAEGRLYIIGAAKFESLVDLVARYAKEPLYRDTRLLYPLTDTLLRDKGSSHVEPVVPYGSPDLYMDPNSVVTPLRVRSICDYRAQRDDELSFPANTVIENVVKREGGWWQGDLGPKSAHYFPATFVEEIPPSPLGAGGRKKLVGAEISVAGDDNLESSPLASLQRGCFDIVGARAEVVELPPNRVRTTPGEVVCFVRLTGTDIPRPLLLGSTSKAEAEEWAAKIKEVSEVDEGGVENGSSSTASSVSTEAAAVSRDVEKIKRIAKELSNLIVYCQSVSFSTDVFTVSESSKKYREMSSFPENKIEKWLSPTTVQSLLQYNFCQFTRVYPKGQRLDSSNYDPVRMWNAGCQMVALNYQTPDRAMQLNEGKFRQNGGCGYVLMPSFMWEEGFNPHDPTTFVEEPMLLSIRIIAARHLIKSGRSVVSPFVEVEVCGVDRDSRSKFVTETVHDNGLNPFWDESFCFEVSSPSLALLRLTVQDEDMFGEPKFLAVATYPISCIRPGYRSVPLRNGYSEPLYLSALLVHVETIFPRLEAQEAQKLRDMLPALKSAAEDAEKNGDVEGALLRRREFDGSTSRLLNLMERQQKRRSLTATNSTASLLSSPSSYLVRPAARKPSSGK